MSQPVTPGPIVHGACGKTWSGLSRSHCPSCHETFSSESAANLHRVGQFGVDRRCVEPATVGLVASEKPWGRMWSRPGTPPQHWAAEPEQPTDTAAAQWNAQHPIGTPVHAWPGLRTDDPIATRTRTPAWTLGHGTPVVSVDGYAGGIALDHIEPRDPAAT